VEFIVPLPEAAPDAYRRWARSRGDATPDGAGDGPSLRRAALREVERQAERAEADGRATVAPLLEVQAEMWDLAERGELDWDLLIPPGPADEELTDRIRETLRTTMVTGVVSSRSFRMVATGPGRLRLFGEVDMVVGDQIHQVVTAELEAGHRIVLDAAGLAFIDSQGLRVLIMVGAAAERLGLAPVVVQSAPPILARLLEVVAPRGFPGVELR